MVLKILVGKDGSPLTITIDPATEASATLSKAAIEAAERWRFNPATEEGKPIQAYTRVPITFSLTPLPDQPQKAGAKAES